MRAGRLVCAALLVALNAGGSCYVSASTCFCEGDWCDDDCNTCSNSYCNPRCRCDVRNPVASKGKQKPTAIHGYERHKTAGPDGSPRELLRAIDGPSMSPHQVGLATERLAFVRALIEADPVLFGAGPFEPLGDSASEGGPPWVTLVERADGEPLAVVLDAAGRIEEIELPARSLPAVELPAGLSR
jgi:hypothetical protein